MPRTLKNNKSRKGGSSTHETNNGKLNPKFSFYQIPSVLKDTILKVNAIESLLIDKNILKKNDLISEIKKFKSIPNLETTPISPKPIKPEEVKPHKDSEESKLHKDSEKVNTDKDSEEVTTDKDSEEDLAAPIDKKEELKSDDDDDDAKKGGGRRRKKKRKKTQKKR